MPTVPTRPDPSPRPTVETAPDRTGRAGLLTGIAAYGLWGLLPLYFPLLAPSGAVEIIAHRVVWSLLLCGVLLTVTRTWAPFVTTLRSARTMVLLAVAAVLLAANWLIFVFGTLTDRVVDAALGYYINPLVTVALAVLVLHERLRPLQWTALGSGALAVVVITAGYGQLPWIALSLALTFAGYALLKSLVGRSVGAVPGLAAETLVLAPAALVYLVVLGAVGTGSFTAAGGWHAAALVSSGVVTAVPLLLFNSAARRLPLSVVGMLQYITPTMQLLIGVLVMHEHMPPARWWGFALVWVALVLITLDGVRSARRPRF